MSRPNSTLAIWNRLSSKPGGRWLFTRVICWKAPYFGSIRPAFVELRPGYCEVRMKKRRAVHNHIGTVHAIAICNLAELAAGVMTDASMPPTHRWIPKGMTVEYVGKAGSDLRGIGKIEPMPEFGESADLPVQVEVFDTEDKVVFRAMITMWVSPRKTQA